MASPAAESWSFCIDVASRVVIAIVGLSWFLVAVYVRGALSAELEFTQQRGPSLSIGEWILLVQMIAGLLLVALACSPRTVLNITVIRWSFVPVVLLVEVGLAFIAYHWGYELYRDVPALGAIMLGIVLGFAAMRLLKPRPT